MTSRKPKQFHNWPEALDVPYVYKIVIEGHVDGDGVDVMADMGLREYTYEAIRLHGYDAPEIYGRKTYDGELEDGYAALEHLRTILPVGTQARAQTFKDKTSFDRYEANIELIDGRDVSTMMIEAGWTKQACMERRGIL